MPRASRSRLPRLDKARVFEDLGYWPHAGQQAVHDSKAMRRVLACGVRWGKTSVGVYEVVTALLEPREAESVGWVVGPDHGVSDRILKLAHRALEKRAPHRILEARGHTLRVRSLSGHVAVAEGRSTDNPASLLGEGLDWLVIDEAARLKDSIWDEHLSQRLVEKRGWALILSTPRGAGWFYTAFKRGRGEDPGYQSWTGPTWECGVTEKSFPFANAEQGRPAVPSQPVKCRPETSDGGQERCREGSGKSPF